MLLLTALLGTALAQPLPEGDLRNTPPAPPLAHATLAADGSYDMVIQPPQGWDEAEITVSGDGSHDLGAALTDEPVHLSGWTSVRGPLSVTVQAATGNHRGTTWIFTVEPELVPTAPPAMEGADHEGKGLFGIFGRGR